MRVMSAAAMQEADRRTIADRGIPGLQLMEAAGRACAEVIAERFPGEKVVIVAGSGNNGGDGFVIARLLAEQGRKVQVVVLAEQGRVAGDAAVNLRKLPPSGVLFAPGGIADHAELLRDADLVVDALFGTGLGKELAGAYAETVSLMNACGKPVVAVDIPSGIDGSSGRIRGAAVRASVTVTFAAAKLGHVLYPGAEFVGDLVVADIGIPGDILDDVGGAAYVDTTSAAGLVRPRARTAHKGNFGHTLIIAGSRGKTGAAALAAGSAVRAGAGLVTLSAPDRVHDILEVKTTEAMTFPVPDAGRGFFGAMSLHVLVELLQGKDSVALGPGISWHPETSALVRKLFPLIHVPVVVDADGLNALSEDPSILKASRSPAVVLTPHPGEMARLCGRSVAEIEADRLETARSFAVEYGVHLVLKGARTVTATPAGELFINGSGNPGMASGGMGDVLTGILAALLGQGYSATEACRLGVFLHGCAADRAAMDVGEAGLAAGDLIPRLPQVYQLLLQEKSRC